MSAIHVLTGNGPVYNVVVHVATPVGNNSAGVLWSDAIKGSGRNTSVMAVGNGSGQITQNEMNQISAGTIIEAQMQWGDDVSLTNAQRLAAIDVAATHLANDLIAQYAADLKYFGLTRG
jgi:hypothetical protein